MDEVLARATVDSPIGPLIVETTAEGLVALSFASAESDARAAGVVAEQGPVVSGGRDVAGAAARADQHLGTVVRELAEYMAGERTSFDIPIDWSRSTGFRRDVLEELTRVPFGAVVTYGELASRVGHPRAARAVGTAMATNPVAVVVPCHRVVRSGGRVGGYGGGAEMKAWLLELEGVL